MTNLGKINNKTHKKRILVAPLDWGLGHATRCIPLIKLLIKHGAEPIIAADNAIASLLQNEFPGLVILRLKGYNVSYSKHKNFFFLKMLTQVSKIKAAVKYEKKWLAEMIIDHKIDAIISDNRFGLYTIKVPCVFITHQLSIKTNHKFLDKQAQKINYKYINKFNECWVPDAEGMNNFAGELSHPKILPVIPVKYIGILSRCEKLELKKEFELLIMLSGPESQRTIFENILIKELKDITDSVVLLRGLPAEKKELIPENKNISIFNHLPAHELNELIQRSKLVVASCGYSTIMDLASLNQKAILVPTPGQTEQEYLAKYLKKKKMFFTAEQKKFSLKRELENVKDFEFVSLNSSPGMNENVIVEWLENI